MSKYIHPFVLIFLLISLVGCGPDGILPEAQEDSDVKTPPTETFSHPDNWEVTHSEEPRTRLQNCKNCHGIDYRGGDSGVSCFTCHLEGSPFNVHPRAWPNVSEDHHVFANTYSWTGCAAALCHGSSLQGGEEGPSCYNVSCHINTAGSPPAPANHQGTNFLSGSQHGVAAKSSQNICLNCHGRPDNIFDGGFISDPSGMGNSDHNNNPVQGDCSTCHASAEAHPTNWQGNNDTDTTYISSHRFVDEATQEKSCALCHNINAAGPGEIKDAPSCYAATHSNADGITSTCHATGPQNYSHPLEGDKFIEFLGEHGNIAKLDLTRCQRCHGDPATSGPGSNPRFNLPATTNGCERCHSAYFAHPPEWAGPNIFNTTHYSAQNIDKSCTLCHGVNLDGAGGVNASGGNLGQSCLTCHVETNDFALDCTSCHGYPPDGTRREPVMRNIQPVNHFDVANGEAGESHDTCLVCHGVRATEGSSGKFLPAGEYRLFDPLTDTYGGHWDGKINMNGPTGVGAGYNPDNFGCGNATICHGNDSDHQLSDSESTLAFGNYLTPHPQGEAFRAGNSHGTLAKKDLANCKICHGGETDINPRYIIGINSASGVGCEGCHNSETAHPSSPAPDNAPWYNGPWRHDDANIKDYTCGMCHIRPGWQGTVAPSCLECHVSDPVDTVAGTCVSCHGNGPDGTSPPNRIGRHYGEHDMQCTICHTNAGPGSELHFTKLPSGFARADLRSTPDSLYNRSMVISVTPDNVTCTGICHINHESFPWY